MGGIIESDTAGEFVWGVWNCGFACPRDSILSKFLQKTLDRNSPAVSFSMMSAAQVPAASSPLLSIRRR